MHTQRMDQYHHVPVNYLLARVMIAISILAFQHMNLISDYQIVFGGRTICKHIILFQTNEGVSCWQAMQHVTCPATGPNMPVISTDSCEDTTDR